MEDKKKKKTNTIKKNTNSKKPVAKKAPAKKGSSVKKVAGKKPVKKVAPKKPAPKKVETPKVEPKKVEKEELEKTIIFDGRQNKNLREVVENLEKDNVVVEDQVIKRKKGNSIAIAILAILMVGVVIATTCYALRERNKNIENNQTINSNIYNKVNRNVNNNEKKNELTTNDVDKKVYEKLDNITLKAFEEKVLAKEDMLILIASNTCYHCATFEPIVNEVLQTRGKTIYRLDVAKLTSTEVDRFRTYYAFTVTPTIFYLKDGVVKAESTGSMTKEEFEKWVDENVK